ncbi:ste24p [Saccharomyces arboricola H-6]|uniref:CAAX prenyl protease n=1 Tax=Saccharomyces arboricola (strain H-6 / AS 2.3317 / CBS 10644) TaxID=1160507 RepID=J8LM06_SACAR|nr:ste24p [Saccharomyces arboricola H-6]
MFDLKTFLDRPNIPWKLIISAFSIAQFSFESYLTYRQYQKLSETKLPPVLEDEIDDETFHKSRNYSRAKAKFSIFGDVYNLAQKLVFIKYDFFPKIWHMAVTLSNTVLPARFHMVSTVAQSLCFLGLLSSLSTLVDLPLSYYGHFVLEEKFGFNKLTVKLWFTDMIKSLTLAYAIGGPILYLFLKIFDKFPTDFLWYIMVFLFIVQILAMTIIPVFIMPLFNKFTPLEDGELKKSIESLAERVGFPLDKIFVIDGSKRSSHSNAYFTGLPFTSKRIVLFDTLVNSNSTDEITAVLAHEIGHWQKNHIVNMVIFSQLHTFLIFTLFTSVYRNFSFYNTFGFFVEKSAGSFIDPVITMEFPIIIGFMLFNDLLTPLECAMQFIMSLISRTHEYQADAYAKKLGYKQNLCKALIDLQIKNLSTMNVDPLYSSYHYSHPTLAERLTALDYVSEKKKN